MVSTIPNFDIFPFEGQEHTKNFGYSEDNTFPLALQAKSDWKPTLEEAISSLKQASQSGLIFEQVKKHGGAVLLRGLPIKTPDDYSRIAHAFGFEAHEEVGRPPIRTVLAPNVKTANEGYV
jgi:hypothetical protein